MVKRRIFVLIAVLLVIAAGIGAYVFLAPTSVSPESDIFAKDREILGSTAFSRECVNGDFVADPSKKVVEIYMSAYQWQYSYCSITVYEGQTVLINMMSLDVPHGMSIEGMPRINVLISPGAVSTVKFEATEKGSFTYFCTVFCGEGHPNHKGTLIVR